MPMPFLSLTLRARQVPARGLRRPNKEVSFLSANSAPSAGFAGSSPLIRRWMRSAGEEFLVEKDAPRIVHHLKTEAARREIDLHCDIAEYLRKYMARKTGLLLHTANGTPYLNGNLKARWLTPKLKTMGLDQKGTGWHAFRRFRKTWLRGQRCLEDINNLWMAHLPQTISELYSHLYEESQLRLDEAERIGYGFVLL
jgi:hypothetical protein